MSNRLSGRYLSFIIPQRFFVMYLGMCNCAADTTQSAVICSSISEVWSKGWSIAFTALYGLILY